jgi:hypothetical protein
MEAHVTEPSKACNLCGKVKPLSEFWRDSRRRDGYRAACRPCERIRNANWMEENREYRAGYAQARMPRTRELARQRTAAGTPGTVRKRVSRRATSRKLREQVLAHYGDKCACCGTRTQLGIDHVAGNGAAHRSEILGDSNAGGAPRFYLWLVRNNFPTGYQVLCQPCNRSKGTGPRCRIIHIGGLTGLGWPNDDGATCYGPKLLGVKVTK